MLLVPLGEPVCGPLRALGPLTPVAAGFLSVEILTAIRKIHFPKGFFNFKGGWEFQGTLLLALAGFGLGSPGPIALDERLGGSLGPIAYVVVMALGIAITLPGLKVPCAAPADRWTGRPL